MELSAIIKHTLMLVMIMEVAITLLMEITESIKVSFLCLVRKMGSFRRRVDLVMMVVRFRIVVIIGIMVCLVIFRINNHMIHITTHLI